jgi:hypothetical protein
MIGKTCFSECCCPVFGIQSGMNPVAALNCCNPASVISSIENNLDRLSECRVVFIGNDNCCCDAVAKWTDPAKVAQLKDYVNAGGRLWMQTEYGPTVLYPPGSPDSYQCIQNRPALENFLSQLGSSMMSENNKCGEDSGTQCVPGAAQIAQGLQPADYWIQYWTARISGGTSVWLHAASNQPCVAVEKLGSGFFFLCGDSNPLSAGQPNCNFIRRLWEYSDDQII